jgi:hypothetical protein
MSVTEHEMAAVLGYKGTLPSDEWLTTNLTERATDSVPLWKGVAISQIKTMSYAKGAILDVT